jgi:uncharacterized OsmC-like protein
MNAEELRAVQQPIKSRYQADPASALITLKAHGSIVACAGVTLASVATAFGVKLQDAVVRAEGDLDFRGTMGVAKDAPVGFQNIRLHFDLVTDAAPEVVTKLIAVTERYCVVYQTLRQPPLISVSQSAAGSR